MGIAIGWWKNLTQETGLLKLKQDKLSAILPDYIIFLLFLAFQNRPLN